jgi:ribosomal protein L31
MKNDFYICWVCHLIISSYDDVYILCDVCGKPSCCYSTHYEDEKNVDICDNCIGEYKNNIAYLKMSNEEQEKYIHNFLCEYKNKKELQYEALKKNIQKYFID